MVYVAVSGDGKVLAVSDADIRVVTSDPLPVDTLWTWDGARLISPPREGWARSVIDGCPVDVLTLTPENTQYIQTNYTIADGTLRDIYDGKGENKYAQFNDILASPAAHASQAELEAAKLESGIFLVIPAQESGRVMPDAGTS